MYLPPICSLLIVLYLVKKKKKTRQESQQRLLDFKWVSTGRTFIVYTTEQQTYIDLIAAADRSHCLHKADSLDEQLVNLEHI